MTLNEIYFKVLKPILESNPFIQDIGFGSIEEYGLSGEVKPPFAWATVQNIRRVNNLSRFSLLIAFGDIVAHDKSNVIDIQSDMIEVAHDVAGALIDHPNIEANEDFSIEIFEQRLHDLTAGATLDISISVPHTLINCINC
jgi:hypothetical protein